MLEFLSLEQNILCWSTSPHIWEWVLFVMVPSIWILIKIPYFFTRFRSICSCFIHLPFLIQHHSTHIHCMIVFLWNHGQYLHIMLRIFQDVCPFSPGFIFENCALHFFACTQDYVGHKSTFFSLDPVTLNKLSTSRAIRHWVSSASYHLIWNSFSSLAHLPFLESIFQKYRK